MNKYYVVSGKLNVVLSGRHISCARQAACEALLMYHNCSLAPLIIVSERGTDFHNHDPTEDVVLATVDILKEAGLYEEN
jgi:hypothetical protein